MLSFLVFPRGCCAHTPLARTPSSGRGACTLGRPVRARMCPIHASRNSQGIKEYSRNFLEPCLLDNVYFYCVILEKGIFKKRASRKFQGMCLAPNSPKQPIRKHLHAKDGQCQPDMHGEAQASAISRCR